MARGFPLAAVWVWRELGSQDRPGSRTLGGNLIECSGESAAKSALKSLCSDAERWKIVPFDQGVNIIPECF